MTFSYHDCAIFRGCSPSKVSRDIRKGLLRATDDKRIDPFEQLNREWLRARNVSVGGRPASDVDDEDEEDSSLSREKTEAEIRYKKAATDRYELQNSKSRHDLIPREMVVAMAGAFSSGIRTYLLGLPARISGTLVAKVKSGGETDVQPYLEAELADSIERALSMGETTSAAVLEHWGDEDEDEEVDE